MENQNTTQGGIKTVLIIFIIFGLIFCLLKCNNQSKNLDKKEIEFKTSINSSRIEFEKLKLFSEKLKLDLDLANDELLEAHNKTQIAETILYKLRQNNKRPAYVPEIKPCNDTIQKVYNLSIKKDSAFNDVITGKNIELKEKDTIINIQKSEKSNLIFQVQNQKIDNNILQNQVVLEKKKLKSEKIKKIFWQSTTGLALIYIGKLLFIK